jgi:hypothetical protein
MLPVLLPALLKFSRSLLLLVLDTGSLFDFSLGTPVLLPVYLCPLCDGIMAALTSNFDPPPSMEDVLFIGVAGEGVASWLSRWRV